MTKKELLAAIDREIAMRERVYPARVAVRAMTAKKAEHEISAMKEIRSLIALLAKDPPSSPPHPILPGVQ